MELTVWDIVQLEPPTPPHFSGFFKNEHHGKSGRALDRELMEVVFETRKRVLLGNPIEDQAARLDYLREARARMN